jgi:hypothetical protein
VAADEHRRQEKLPPEESMRLLSSVALGRVVFTARALPAIRLVSHVVDGDQVVIRTGADAPVTAELISGRGTVVAYEADLIDPADHLGWSVTVIGEARQVADPRQAEAYRWALRSWEASGADQIITIQAGMVTGFRLVHDPALPAEAP